MSAAQTIDFEIEREARDEIARKISVIIKLLYNGTGQLALRDRGTGNQIELISTKNVNRLPTILGDNRNSNCGLFAKRKTEGGEDEIEEFRVAPTPIEAQAEQPAPVDPVAETPVEAPAVMPKVKAKAAHKVEAPVEAPAAETVVVGTPAAESLDEDNDNHAEDDDDADDEPHGNEEEVSIPKEKMPCFRVFEKWTRVTEHNKRFRPGVHHFGKKTVKGDQVVYTHNFVCTPLFVDAIASDEAGTNYGRVLRFINPKGKTRTWAMPMEMLAGNGENLRAELLAQGVVINPDSQKLLLKYISEAKPIIHVRCATQVGWSGNSFVLPAAVIGPNAINVVFQSGERAQAEYAARGTLEGWREEIAARAIGNPVLMMSLSAAFVGPLLEKVGGESGGIHLVDNSSVGKSTAIKAAASVWGGPKYVRSWNATSNGLEGVAALYNDGLLPLDEISECAAHDISRIVYALANGVGRQRASRSGAARSVTRWKCFVISSGERMIATELLNAGLKAKAGQLVRIIDLPVARAHGVWDDLHDAASGGAFSDLIKNAAAKHHGVAGPAYLERLTRDGRNWAEAFDAVKRLPCFAVEGDAGQDARVMARFALIGMAGELATEYGITGWPAGAATRAAATMFQTWQQHRKHGNREPQQILEQLSGFLQRHGDSRFSEDRGHENDAVSVRDRAGWYERGYGDEEKTHWFTPDGLREALKGFDFERALDVLVEAGVMPDELGPKGERAKQKKIRGQKMYLYRILSDALI